MTRQLGRAVQGLAVAALLLAPACGRLGYDSEGATPDPQEAGTLPITVDSGVPGNAPGPSTVAGPSCADLPHGSPSGTYTLKSGTRTFHGFCNATPNSGLGHGPGYTGTPSLR